MIKAAAYLSQQIEHLPEREGFDLHGLVRGTIIGVRKASSPEAYTAWLAIFNWKDALNDLDKLREESAAMRAEIDALKSEIELLRAELGNRPTEGAQPVDVWPDRW